MAGDTAVHELLHRSGFHTSKPIHEYLSFLVVLGIKVKSCCYVHVSSAADEGGGWGGGKTWAVCLGPPVYKGAHANSAGLVQIISSSSVTFQSKGLNMLLWPLNKGL